ncbi:hypothetical protein PIB30_081555 [Stylosanthes scabra]|uniref:Uncharacterized protein n=1 Tax=Stylosanthes scabra TaxID=79078 RepID=A0ABU6YQV1_9FABA|nr:hypothetical protein [Stylosanthes scabra]
MEKNKKKREKQGIGAAAPPGGAAARSENVIFLAIGATAPPRPLHGAHVRLAPPRPPYVAPARAPARPARPRDGLGASAPSPWLLSGRVLQLARAHAFHMACPRGGPYTFKPCGTLLFPIFFSTLFISLTTPIHIHSPIPLDCVNIAHYSLTKHEDMLNFKCGVFDEEDSNTYLEPTLFTLSLLKTVKEWQHKIPLGSNKRHSPLTSLVMELMRSLQNSYNLLNLLPPGALMYFLVNLRVKGMEKSMRKAKKNIGSKDGLEGMEKACKSGDFTKEARVRSEEKKL